MEAQVDRSEFIVILDRSGSMARAKKDHEGGLKHFVEEQQKLPGKTRLTFIRFDGQEPCEIVYDRVKIAEAQDLKLEPRGNTPLLDAIGLGVTHAAAKLKALKKQPDQVVVVIITDGEENASQEWTLPAVLALIMEREAQGWKFLFLGANIDAFAVAADLGVGAGTTMNFANDKQGVKRSYEALTANSLRSRQVYSTAPRNAAGKVEDELVAVAATAALEWTEEQRQAAIGGDDQRD